MTAKPERTPTDAAIIKGFEKFEQGMNTFMAYCRTNKDEVNQWWPGLMWEAHSAYRDLAVAAQARIDAKKEGKSEDK